VIALRTRGRIMDVLTGGRYRVAVGGLTTVCREEDLETMSASKKQTRRERDAPSLWAGPDTLASLSHPADLRQLQSLDLHGATVPEALSRLGAFIDRAIRAGLDRVEIIHGISGGRLRAAVRGQLAGMPSIARFAPDPRNAGVTIVYF